MLLELAEAKAQINFRTVDQFQVLASMCICLAYVRAIVGLVLGQLPDGEPGSFDYSQRTSIHTSQERMKNVSFPGIFYLLPHTVPCNWSNLEDHFSSCYHLACRFSLRDSFCMSKKPY